LIGVVLIVVGVLISIPFFWYVIAACAFGGPRVRLALGTLGIIPVGTVFHGVLLLWGIHPRDFYGWWDSLSNVGQSLLLGLLILLALGLVILFFFVLE
jgi:hypothetical protein